MTLLTNFKAAMLATATLGLVGASAPTWAVTSQAPIQPMGPRAGALLAQNFGNVAVNAANFLVVAVPGTTVQPYRLVVVEQIKSTPACWSLVNSGARPTQVNDLWNKFDYTGTCRVQKDSNGYSVRLNGEDVASPRFEVNERNGELLLQFAPSASARDRITIGRTGGISPTRFTQIHLDPGWYLTKRTFEGQVVSSNLVYFTNDLTLAQLQSGTTTGGGGTTPPPTPPTPPPVTASFRDIAGNRYAADIERAADLGVMSGFAEDGTFRPANPLTREAAVSVVMETAKRILSTSILAGLPQSVYSAPFPDVAANRWSAVKIAQAKQLGLITGDFETGNFRPGDNVTRAQLMAMFQKLALARVNSVAPDPNAPANQAGATVVPPNVNNPVLFSDISGHWGANAIQQMASYCAIASPLNETGTSFAPDSNALRDYTAAAAVRLIDCPAGRPR